MSEDSNENPPVDPPESTEIAPNDTDMNPDEPTEPPNKVGGTSPWTILMAGFIGALIGVIVGAFVTTSIIQQMLPSNLLRTSERPTDTSVEGLTAASGIVIDVAEKVSSSVVNISFMNEGDFSLGGQGSGVIFRSDGYILTNAHVVVDATEIVVTLPGGEDAVGVLLGLDVDNDIAVVKVDRTGLPAATFGTAADLRVGELAVVVGSPFGLDLSVTAGVISALSRNVSASDSNTPLKTLTNLIQTDASINPGNSGGALANHEGKVVGINTLIFTTNGSGQGIGFAITSDHALKLAEEIIETGTTTAPYIGVCISDVDPAESERLGASKGAHITQTLEGSPAEDSDLQADDVITLVDEVAIGGASELIAEVRKHSVDDVLEIDFAREGESLDTTVTLGDKPEDGPVCSNFFNDLLDDDEDGTPDALDNDGIELPPNHP